MYTSNPIVFLEQMLSFGSPTSVVGARAAAGHVAVQHGVPAGGPDARGRALLRERGGAAPVLYKGAQR